MENNSQLLKEKLELFFLTTLQTLEKATENELNTIEEIKYDVYDHCIYEFNKITIEDEESNHIETCPNQRPIDKKENNMKKPVKVQDKRPKTPTKIFTPAVNPKAKPIENNKTNNKRTSVKNENSKRLEKVKSAMSKTTELKRSPTTIPPKKEERKSNIKAPNKTPKATTKKLFASKTVHNDEKANKEKEDLNQAINSIIIIPQLIPKYIYKIPEQLKSNNKITMMYILTKTYYLIPKKKYILITLLPLLYKEAYNSSLSFFIEPKITNIKSQIKEIESLFSSYGDIESYLSKTFFPSKTAQNSLTFVTKEEELNLSKREDLPKEIGFLFQLVYYIFDEKFDDTMTINQLITDFLNTIIPKYDAKDLSKII